MTGAMGAGPTPKRETSVIAPNDLEGEVATLLTTGFRLALIGAHDDG